MGCSAAELFRPGGTRDVRHASRHQDWQPAPGVSPAGGCRTCCLPANFQLGRGAPALLHTSMYTCACSKAQRGAISMHAYLCETAWLSTPLIAGQFRCARVPAALPVERGAIPGARAGRHGAAAVPPGVWPRAGPLRPLPPLPPGCTHGGGGGETCPPGPAAAVISSGAQRGLLLACTAQAVNKPTWCNLARLLPLPYCPAGDDRKAAGSGKRADQRARASGAGGGAARPARCCHAASGPLRARTRLH